MPEEPCLLLTLIIPVEVSIMQGEQGVGKHGAESGQQGDNSLYISL